MKISGTSVVAESTVEKVLPLGVILTIPAAGSEGRAGNSVITRLDGLRKLSLRTRHRGYVRNSHVLILN